MIQYHTLPADMVGMAQLVRALGCGPGDRGFESHYSPHETVVILKESCGGLFFCIAG